MSRPSLRVLKKKVPDTAVTIPSRKGQHAGVKFLDNVAMTEKGLYVWFIGSDIQVATAKALYEDIKSSYRHDESTSRNTRHISRAI